MYICICKSLTESDIRRGVLEESVSCMQSLRERLGASTGCGGCEDAARDCLKQALMEKKLIERTREQARWEQSVDSGVFDRRALYGDAAGECA